MKNDKIIQTITAIFSGADARDWPKVKAALANKVLLDYSSMNGNPAAVTSSEGIITTWSSFLPGFDKTHHNVFDFKVEQQGDSANVHFTGKADHYIGEDKWIVEGTYDVEVTLVGEDWKVSKFRFNFEQQSGNTTLPQRVMEIAKQKP